MVLGTVGEQAIFRGGLLAGKLGAPWLEDAAKFVTGQATGGKLMRFGSSAAGGVTQGAITGSYDKYMGQKDDIGDQMLLGAGAGPLTNMLFAPYRSNIAPEVGELARDWSKAGLGLSAAQLPGAPPALRALSKIFNPK